MVRIHSPRPFFKIAEAARYTRAVFSCTAPRLFTLSTPGHCEDSAIEETGDPRGSAIAPVGLSAQKGVPDRQPALDHLAVLEILRVQRAAVGPQGGSCDQRIVEAEAILAGHLECAKVVLRE